MRGAQFISSRKNTTESIVHAPNKESKTLTLLEIPLKIETKRRAQPKTSFSAHGKLPSGALKMTHAPFESRRPLNFFIFFFSIRLCPCVDVGFNICFIEQRVL